MTGRRLAVVLAAVVLTGCGAADDGAAAGSGPTTFTRVLPGDDYTVPAVAEPLDLRPYAGNPCSLLTAEQASGLGLPDAEPRSDETCKWHDSAGSPMAGIIGGPRVGDGLAGFYARYRETGDGSWEPADVAGYPAAYANGEIEARHGQCVLLVGVADDQFLRVEDSDPDGGGCARATEAAELVVANLRAPS